MKKNLLALTFDDIQKIIQEPETAPIPETITDKLIMCGAIATQADESNFSQIIKYACRLEMPYTVLLIKLSLWKELNLSRNKAFVDWATRMDKEWNEILDVNDSLFDE